MAIKENSKEIIQNLHNKIRSRNRIAVILTILQIMGYYGSMRNGSSHTSGNLIENLAEMVGFNLFIIIAIIIWRKNSRLKNEIRKLENVDDQG